MSPIRPRTRMRWALALYSLVSVLLCACASGGTMSARPTTPTGQGQAATLPSTTLTMPPTHSIALGDFQASYVLPGAHGLVLYGNPGTVGRPIGPAGGYALYY